MKNGNSHLLVADGKSSRLEAIKQKAGLKIAETSSNIEGNRTVLVQGLSQTTKEALQQANVIIDETINKILNAYPAGKRSTFFKLKYGVQVDCIKLMLIADIFQLLKLDTKSVKHFALIKKIFTDGKQSDT